MVRGEDDGAGARDQRRRCEGGGGSEAIGAGNLGHRATGRTHVGLQSSNATATATTANTAEKEKLGKELPASSERAKAWEVAPGQTAFKVWRGVAAVTAPPFVCHWLRRLRSRQAPSNAHRKRTVPSSAAHPPTRLTHGTGRR